MGNANVSIIVKAKKGSFAVFPNGKKEWTVKLARELEKYMLGAGFAKKESGSGKKHTNVFIGGDGTIFHYFQKLKIKGNLVLIGSNHTYHSQFGIDSWEDGLIRLIESGRSIELAKLTLYDGNRNPIGHALNEVAFLTSNHRIAAISYDAQDVSDSFRGDGLLIATPFGSSGYSYSAGGVLLSLKSGLVALTPICPILRIPPASTSPALKFAITRSKNVDVLLDNIVPVKECIGDELTVKKSPSGLFYLGKEGG